MNTINETRKDNETKSHLPLIGRVLLVVIALVLLKQYFDPDDKYFNGEELISRKVTVSDSIEYIEGGTDRYTFKAKQFNCRFWIMGGALNIVRNNKNLKSKVESISIGDTLKLDLYKEADDHLNKENYRAKVIGLSGKGTEFYNPGQVKSIDKNNRRLELKLGTIFFFGLLLALNWKRIRTIWT